MLCMTSTVVIHKYVISPTSTKHCALSTIFDWADVTGSIRSYEFHRLVCFHYTKRCINYHIETHLILVQCWHKEPFAPARVPR